MTPESFAEHFHLLVDAPNGVQKLREMILQLAVRGRLVPQHPRDEPASVLLKKIKTEKGKLMKEGKIKKQKPLPAIEPDEVRYELPKGWEWTRVRAITHDLGQKVPDAPFTYVDVTAIDKECGCISSKTRLLEAKQAPSRARKLVEVGTVIYSTVRPYLLNIAIIDRQFDPEPIVSTAFAVLHPFTGVSSEYLYHYLRSQPFIKYANDAMTGMAYPAINDAKMSVGPVPLPPHAEQKRIVARVGQLMALCDELEARQENRAKNRITLNNACLNGLTSPDGDSAEEAWQRIGHNFDLLYDCPENVSALRQSVLQLAVRGRLVAQDPKEKPTSVLLKRIKVEKEKLIREGKIKKAKPLPPIEPDEVRYELPDGWEWVCLGDATINRDGERVPLSREERRHRQGSYDYYGASGVIDRIDDYLFDKPLLLIGEDGANLINRATPIAFIAHGEYWVNNHAHVIDGISLELLRYLELFVNATDLRSYVTGTAQPKMNQAKMNSIAVALPPLAEQKRIVAKVDQLMVLCDELEAKLTQSQSAAETLVSAVVNELAAA